MRIELAEGKYTYINDEGAQRALRYGEEWRDLTGDNLIYWMGVEIEEGRERLEEAVWLLTTDPTEPLNDFRAEREAGEEYDRRLAAFLEQARAGEENDG